MMLAFALDVFCDYHSIALVPYSHQGTLQLVWIYPQLQDFFDSGDVEGLSAVIALANMLSGSTTTLVLSSVPWS
jgi:hypothetical protein